MNVILCESGAQKRDNVYIRCDLDKIVSYNSIKPLGIQPRKTPSGILSTIVIGSIDMRRMNLACAPEFSIESLVNHPRVAFRRNFACVCAQGRLNLLHYSIIAVMTFTCALRSPFFFSLLLGRPFHKGFVPTCYSRSRYI